MNADPTESGSTTLLHMDVGGHHIKNFAEFPYACLFLVINSSIEFIIDIFIDNYYNHLFKVLQNENVLIYTTVYGFLNK